MSLMRRKKWEEWKRRWVEACPPKDREAHRRLLDSVPMPTPEQERRMERIRRMVEAVFGRGEPARKRKGNHRGRKR